MDSPVIGSIVRMAVPWMLWMICGGVPGLAAQEKVEGEKRPAGEEKGQPKVFRFRGGERVSIQVAREVNEGIMQFDQVVSSDGFVSSIRFGLVNILGETIEGAVGKIKGRFLEMTGLKTAIVALSLTSTPLQRVYVQGEVYKPKTVEMPIELELTLAAVLADAGGLTEDADISKIKVMRRLAGGEVRLEILDATGFAKPGQNFSGPLLKNGDSVIVPRAESFAVLGEVKTPGIVTRKLCRVPHGQPVRLSHVLATGGGLSAKADREAVTLVRTDEKGNRIRTLFKAQAIEQGAPDQDPEMKDGDQVVVPASEGIMILGAINGPGIYYIPIGPPTLLRLVALAGGFAPMAEKKAVLVVKRTHPGKPQTVDMRAIIEKGQLDKDIPVAPGDLVYVPSSAP